MAKGKRRGIKAPWQGNDAPAQQMFETHAENEKLGADLWASVWKLERSLAGLRPKLAKLGKELTPNRETKDEPVPRSPLNVAEISPPSVAEIMEKIKWIPPDEAAKAGVIIPRHLGTVEKEPQKRGRAWQLDSLREILLIVFPPDGLVPADLKDKAVLVRVAPEFEKRHLRVPSIDTIARARGRRKPRH
jgi:hypothetical protein